MLNDKKLNLSLILATFVLTIQINSKLILNEIELENT
jgi:hypothetical protein